MRLPEKRAVSLFMTAALLMSAVLPTGCSNSKKDISEIEDLTGRFFTAVGSGDETAVNDLVEGDFVPDYADMSYLEYTDTDYDGIMKAIFSKTEILSFESINTNRRKREASATLRISAIDVKDFCSSHLKDNLTIAEYTESVDSYTDRVTYNISLDYVFDEGGNCWLVKNSSAEKYMDCFNPGKNDQDHPYFLDVAFFSTEEANGIFRNIYEGLAEGQFEQPLYTLNINDMRAFDMHFYNGEIVYEAAEEFTKAYFRFIVDHGIEIKEIKTSSDDLYHAELSGKAPSVNELFDYLTSDGYIIGVYKMLLRYTYIDDETSSEDKWNYMFAQLYSDLAKEIPNMTGTDFSVEVAIDRRDPDPKEVFMELPLNITKDELPDRASISFTQNNRCIKKAVIEMEDELPTEWYDYLIYYSDKGLYVPNDVIYGTTKDVEWEGTEEYPNQAVEVTESLSEGDIIYGDSQPDSNGVSIHYSKEPGWLNTAGYYVADDSVLFMLKFDHKFDKGTVLEYDWEVDGKEYGSTETVVVDEDGKDLFGSPISSAMFENSKTIIFRLWEEGHTHLIGYVKLTKT